MQRRSVQNIDKMRYNEVGVAGTCENILDCL
jgi:hypothetical protein